MIFDTFGVDDAVGAILAHTYRLGPGAALKKGHVVSSDDVLALTAAGITHVIAVRLAEDDLVEDEIAARVAKASVGANVTVDEASTGRANIFAAARGVLVVDRERVDALNEVDEAITFATLTPYAVVDAGAMVATVKIIPFAAPKAVVERASAAASNIVTVAPFRKKRVGLVLTTLPGMAETVFAKAAAAQRQRLATLGSALVRLARTGHSAPEIATAVRAMLDEGLDLVLVLGASAITDRRDVIPSAIESLGGTVEHFGMPVDPGNLLLLGRVGRTPVVGVPGCARSLKLSGFDWVLERLAADVPITRRDLTTLGAGGLLAEVPARGSPRLDAPKVPRIAAVVLAGGLSRRMGGTNKLVAEVGGVPLVRRVVSALASSQASEIVVVTGHAADSVRAALAGLDVTFVHNAAYEEGLGASLRTGIAALGEDVDGALVALADMPWLRAEHADALVTAFDPEGPHTVCVPVYDGKRGHPVLWSACHFGEMRKLSGDIGARELLARYADRVLSVDVDDAAIHQDIDTPELLARARAVE